MKSTPMEPPAEKPMLNVWHFVLECSNGAKVFLHPSLTSKEVECHDVDVPFDNVLPRSGKGGSNGKGTFKKFKYKTVIDKLKFVGPNAKAKPTAKARV